MGLKGTDISTNLEKLKNGMGSGVALNDQLLWHISNTDVEGCYEVREDEGSVGLTPRCRRDNCAFGRG